MFMYHVHAYVLCKSVKVAYSQFAGARSLPCMYVYMCVRACFCRSDNFIRIGCTMANLKLNRKIVGLLKSPRIGWLFVFFLVDWLVGLVRWLVGVLIGWMIGWLFGLVAGWLVNGLVGWRVVWFIWLVSLVRWLVGWLVV